MHDIKYGIRCPHCSSPNVVSGKLDQSYLDRAMQFAQAAQQFEHKRLSTLGGIAALLVKAVDVLRKDNRCLDCAHRFDDGDSGVATVG